jgi:plasmid stabilization system protein ParE
MIVFKKRFVNKLLKLENWLISEFGEKTARDIIEKIHFSIHQANTFPSPGRRTSIPEIRSLFIPPYIRIYFTRNQENFIVLNMYDLRQNPSKNKYDII